MKNDSAQQLILLSLPLLSFCAKVKDVPITRNSLQPVTESRTIEPDSSASKSSPPVLKNGDNTPCQYWNEIPSVVGRQTGESFQIFSNVILANDKQGKAIIKARLRLNKQPQVLFALSTEANPEKAKIQIPTLDEFMDLADAQNKAGKLHWIKWSTLSLQYELHQAGISASTSFLIKTRNEKTREQIEAQMPGVFSGQLLPLSQNPLYLDLERQIGDKINPETHLAHLLHLQREVGLFSSVNWRERKMDLAIQLAILDKTASDTKLALPEKFCRFAIAQRVQAQLISIKGIKGAPRLNSNGTLVALADTDNAPLESHDLNGAFGIVVNQEWIKAQMANPTAKPQETESTEGFLDFLDYLKVLTQHRSPLLWGATPESSAQGTVQLNAKLLALGFGVFGMTLKEIARDEIVTNAGRIRLREDSADSLALLANIALDLSDSFSTLENPNPLEKALLGPDALESFLAPYPHGVVGQMNYLSLGLAFEALARLEEGQGSESLKEIIRRTGRRSGNKAWAELK